MYSIFCWQSAISARPCWSAVEELLRSTGGAGARRKRGATGGKGGKEGSKGGRWVERLKREAPQQLPIIGGAVPFP